MVKVGICEIFTWLKLMAWELVLPKAFRNCVDVVSKNFALRDAHIFMHQFFEAFDVIYIKEECVYCNCHIPLLFINITKPFIPQKKLWIFNGLYY